MNRCFYGGALGFAGVLIFTLSCVFCSVLPFCSIALEYVYIYFSTFKIQMVLIFIKYLWYLTKSQARIKSIMVIKKKKIREKTNKHS
jgi:hypothetical protein